MSLQRTLVAVAAASLATAALASSHREAPFITTAPKVDASDFYLFNSYEGVNAQGAGPGFGAHICDIEIDPETGVVELPVEWIRDDAVYFNMNRFAGLRPYTPPSDVFDIFKREFDAAYKEGGLFQLTMHPHISGYRSRIWILDELIRYMRSRQGVWFATHADIARHCAETAGRLQCAGSSLLSTSQRPILAFSFGKTRSTRMSCLLGGQGKLCTLRTKISAVIKRSRSPALMACSMDARAAVKFRFTGTFPASSTAMLAIRPPIPGGRTTPTRFFFVSFWITLDSAMAAASTLS